MPVAGAMTSIATVSVSVLLHLHVRLEDRNIEMFEAESHRIAADLAADLPGDLSVDRHTDLVGHRVAHLAGNLGKTTDTDGRRLQRLFRTW